jgi:phage baseplate assembly protein gpV
MRKILDVKQIESMEIEEVVSAYRNGYALDDSYNINTMTYVDLDSKSCTVSVATTPITAGVVALTRSCPTGITAGTNVTVGATVTNKGNMNNNAFTILCTVTRIDNAVIVTNIGSGNLPPLAPNATSAEFPVSFIMPPANVNVVFKAQANDQNNY